MSGTAEIIASLRRKAGMTQEELADRLFVSRSLVSMWELGSRIPNYPDVVRLAGLFHVKESELIREEEYLYRFEAEQKDFLQELDEITRQSGDLCDKIDMDAVLREFLLGLGQKDRDIFVSRYNRAMTNKAIAAEYRMSESAVKVRLTRIRKKLKSAIQKEKAL